MSGPHDVQTPLSPEDATFVERLTEAFAPGPLDSAERAAFDAALEERLAGRRPGWLGVPVLAGTALAALGAWLLLSTDFGPSAPNAPGPAIATAETRSAAEWEEELLDVMSFGEIEGSDAVDELPDDYVAIAAIFLES